MHTKSIEQQVHANSGEKVANVRETVRQIARNTLSSIEAIVEGKRSARGTNPVTLRDLAKHAQHSCTEFGRLGKAALSESVNSGKSTFRSGSVLVASTASGLLAGLADHLQGRSSNKRDRSKRNSAH